MIIEQLRNILILVALLIVGLVINTVFFPNNPICPDDFTNSEEEIADFEKWVDNFYTENPEATISEISRARVDFWIDNNCKGALKRYADYVAGNIDEETKQLIEMVENETKVKIKQDASKPDISNVDLEVFNKVTHELIERGEYEEAIRASKDYLEVYPKEIDPWIHQATAYMHLEDCINAQFSIQQASLLAQSITDIEFVDKMKSAIAHDCICSQ